MIYSVSRRNSIRNQAAEIHRGACQTFPNVLIANPMGFKQAMLFEIDAPEQREAPKVSF